MESYSVCGYYCHDLWSSAAADINEVVPAIEDDSNVLAALRSVEFGDGARIAEASDDFLECLDFASWELGRMCHLATQLAEGSGEDVEDLLAYGDTARLGFAEQALMLCLPRLRALAHAMGSYVDIVLCDYIEQDLPGITFDEIIELCRQITDTSLEASDICKRIREMGSEDQRVLANLHLQQVAEENSDAEELEPWPFSPQTQTTQ